MSRTTVLEVRAMFAEVVFRASANGVADADRLVLQEGMPSVGRAWRLFYMGRRASPGHYPVPESIDHRRRLDPLGYLGWTKAEALATLTLLEADLSPVPAP